MLEGIADPGVCTPNLDDAAVVVGGAVTQHGPAGEESAQLACYYKAYAHIIYIYINIRYMNIYMHRYDNVNGT